MEWVLDWIGLDWITAKQSLLGICSDGIVAVIIVK